MIKFTQGDTPTLTLTATTNCGVDKLDLTGATFESYFKGPNNTTITIPNSQHTADPDQVVNKGKYLLALTSGNTLAIAAGERKEIITKITIGGVITYFHGKNIVTVLPNTPAA